MEYSMKMGYLLFFFLLYGKATGFAEALAVQDLPNNNRVVIVTLDGLRWQEVFGGADSILLNKAVKQNGDLKRFAGKNAWERRQKLMPFLWNVVSRRGQLIGNRRLGSKMNVANPYALSYAGYNELFTGRPDYFIWRNKKVANGNRTIFEYLNQLQPLCGKIASVASWDAFPFILNQARSRITVAVGKMLHKESEVCADTVTVAAACRYIIKHRPRVLHLGMSGTDEAGHENDYANYLRQAHLADRLIAAVWNLLQSLPEYRSNTSLLITTDHGRGRSRRTWHEHGFFVPGSSETWLALLGTGVKPLGESRRREQLYSAQVAGTIGYLVGAVHFRPYTIPLNRVNNDF